MRIDNRHADSHANTNPMAYSFDADTMIFNIRIFTWNTKGWTPITKNKEKVDNPKKITSMQWCMFYTAISLFWALYFMLSKSYCIPASHGLLWLLLSFIFILEDAKHKHTEMEEEERWANC